VYPLTWRAKEQFEMTRTPYQTEPVTDRVKRALLATQRHSWEQGVAAQAFLELGETDMVIVMAKEVALRQHEDGRLGVVGPNHAVTDPAANGEPVLYAAHLVGDHSLHESADRMLAWLLHRAPKTVDGTLHHLTTKPQVWVDSMYMAPPFLAVAGHPREAVRQIDGMRRLLWLPGKQLYAHQWDDGSQAFVRADCWGVGNGWAAAGITRVLRALPADMAEERTRLIAYIREVVDGCLVHQRPDGLFHDIVDDPSSFVETNLAQMLAYTIYRGIAGGWLDPAYLAHADRMRQAAHDKVDTYGLVQGVCAAPRFDRPGTAPEGQAFFLLMEAAYCDYCQVQ
jgi:unsaturated rhamnogalacturonyl hydrolase